MRPTPPLLQLLILLLVIGCDEARGARAAPSVPSEDLFAAPRLMQLALEISADELDVMLSDSHAYGRATLHESGATYADVGLRYKKRPRDEAARSKPDFKVKFNEFGSSAEFHGHKLLLLLAGRDDPSYLSAPIGLELFREAGVPAARYSFAEVQLNGRDLGFYVVVEGVDRAFIGRHFGRKDGNLYDEGKDPDITGKLEKYGGGHGESDVGDLVAAALQADAGLRWQQLGRILDVERFISYAALEVLLWQEENYSMEAAKFRIYHDPDTDRMVFFPKNVEEILGRSDGPLMPEWKGVVARAVMTTPEGVERYHQTIARLLNSVFTKDKVQNRARELAAIIGPAVARGDPEAGGRYEASVARFLDAVAERADFASEQLTVLAAR